MRLKSLIERHIASRQRRSNSVAPRDVYSLLFAAVSGNGDVLRGAAWHIGVFGRRKAMGPIPGNIVFIGVMDIARRRLRNVGQGFAAIGRAVVVEPIARPEEPCIVSAMMPERLREGPM